MSMVKMSCGDRRIARRGMIHYAPFDRTKVRYQLIGKSLVPKTRVGFKALCEFDAPFIIANI